MGARNGEGVLRRTRLHRTQMQLFPPLTVACMRRVAVHEPRDEESVEVVGQRPSPAFL